MKTDEMQVVVFEWRGANAILSKWLAGFPRVRRMRREAGYQATDCLAAWRNQAVKWFLKETDKAWLLMLDDDIVPLKETGVLLACEADIAGCHFFSKNGCEGHGEDGHISMAASKLSRRALQTIAPPWFAFGFNADGTEMVQCECDYFTAKARAAGFHPVKAGLVGHIVPAVMIPGEEGKAKLKFLSQLENITAPEKEKSMVQGGVA
ncbi:MAG TPA: hypothetical protein VMY35_19140 [Phycisphaerae bacterium]|nr:hypothetical protein [Phycisphaerae bacterium]